MNLCAKFHNSSFICVVRINGQKSKWPKFKFHENWPKKILAKKYFKNNYNFKATSRMVEVKSIIVFQKGIKTLPVDIFHLIGYHVVGIVAVKLKKHKFEI